jgi:tetratricopeptide (TPR) repeat protein
MLNDLADKIEEANPADSAEWMRLFRLTSAEVARLPESPLANHLHGMVLHQIGRTDEAILYAWTAATKNLEAIGLWTNLVTYLIEAKRVDDAREVGDYLRSKWPDDEDAIVSAARCLCLNEQFDEADDLLKSLPPDSSDEAGVLLLSVEVAQGKADTRQAAIRFRKLAETFLVSTDWLSQNSESPVFGPVLSHDLLKSIYGSKGEAFDHKRAIEWFLSPHKPKDFFIAPRLPDKMLQGAAETFLKGVPRDEIVCFIDDTFWDTGKNGMALTKNAIRWKAMLEGVWVVKYSAINTLGMELEESRIVFGTDKQQRELTCHSEEFAMGMYRYLSAAAHAFR